MMNSKTLLRKMLAITSSQLFLFYLAAVLTRSGTRPWPYDPPQYFGAYLVGESLVLYILMEILVRPRPTKPVGRHFKLLLEIACLLAALLPRHYSYYYCSRGFEPDDATVCRNHLFGLVVTASFQVYAVFFAYRCSPDVGVLDALFALSMQSLVHWIPPAADNIDLINTSAMAILCCGLLIALRYHRSPPDSHHKSEEDVDEESFCVIV